MEPCTITWSKFSGTSLVYDGTLTYAMKVDTLKTDGYFDPNKSFEFIPVEFRPDNAPDGKH